MRRRNFMPRNRRGCRWPAMPVALGLSLLFASVSSGSAQQIQLAIVGGIGAPDTKVNVTLTMSGDDAGAAVGAGLDILFPVTLGGLTVAPAQDCAIAPRLQATHLLQARLGTSAPGSQRLILDVGTRIPDINALGNGDLATCAFQIPADAPLGVVPLTVSPGSVLVSDADSHILPATGVDGEVTVALVTPTPTVTLTPTPVVPTNTPTNSPTSPVPPSNTPTRTPTITVVPTSTATTTATRTNTVGPTRTNTPGSAPVSGGGGGCTIGTPGAEGVNSLAWLIAPAALLLWRRRRT